MLHQCQPGSGELQGSLLGCLPHLTSLRVQRTESGSPPLPVGWVLPGPGGPGGPRLRCLDLIHCCVSSPSATPAALAQLEARCLTGVEGCDALMEVLPHLQYLTSLALESPVSDSGKLDMVEVAAAWKVLVGALDAPSLLDLRLGRFQCVFPFSTFDIEPGSCLTALTSLSLCFVLGPLPLPPAFCAALTALRRLEITGYSKFNDSVPELPDEFSLLQQLQSLSPGPCNFGGLPPAVAALGGLTHLGIALPNVSDVEDDQALAGAAFLPHLRELVLFAWDPIDDGDEPQPKCMPGGAIALATSLELLDAVPARGCLELRPGDADLLGSLPALCTLVLPIPDREREDEGAWCAQHVPEWQDDAAWQQAQRTLLDDLTARLRAAGVEVQEKPHGQPSTCPRRRLICSAGGFIELAPRNGAHAAALSRILHL